MTWTLGQCVLSKLADDTKLGEVADTREDHAAIYRDLDRLENRADSNLMKLNKGKCQVLHMGRNYPRHEYVLGATQLDSSWAKKEPEGPGRHQG